jgi:adenine/guanine phosphoribosyltransferase-like PRPP-binding protein
MLERGLGLVVAPWLRRVEAVPKSATSAPRDRPRARRHYDSIVAEPQGAIDPPRRIVVVDDFVTRGATLLGACSRVAEVFPRADVRSFAAVRTMTDVEIVGMVDPVVGEIAPEASGETRRRP